MSPAMVTWAGQQLRKMNGKGDLTLLEFCMSLNDASEIRQYLAAYLGSTPEVGITATSRDAMHYTCEKYWCAPIHIMEHNLWGFMFDFMSESFMGLLKNIMTDLVHISSTIGLTTMPKHLALLSHIPDFRTSASHLICMLQVSSFATDFLQRKQQCRNGGGGGGGNGGTAKAPAIAAQVRKEKPRTAVVLSKGQY